MTATVYWSIDDFSFPGDAWNDFVVVIAGWWLNQAIELITCRKTAVFEFMDGPFSVTMEAEEKGLLCRCMRSGKEHTIWKEVRLTDKQLVIALISFATDLQATLVKNKVAPEKDLDLAGLADRLRGLLVA